MNENINTSKTLSDSNVHKACWVINAVGCVTGKNDKTALLKDASGNEILRQMLRMTYDPYTRYGVRKLTNVWLNADLKQKDFSYAQIEQTFYDFKELCDAIVSREVTGNAAKERMKAFLKSMPLEYGRVYANILEKDLHAGINVNIINKVFPGLIPVYSAMLATKLTPEEVSAQTGKSRLLPLDAIYEPKLDGFRIHLWRTIMDKYMRSREGRDVYGYDEILRQAESLPSGFVYDGEMVDEELLPWIRENIRNGGVTAQNRDLFIKSVSQRGRKESGKRGTLVLFDMIPMEGFETGSAIPYYKRLEFLKNTLECVNLPNIALIPSYKWHTFHNKGEAAEAAMKYLSEFTQQGWEGVIIRDANGGHECKRSKLLLKLKYMDTVDLPVIDVEEGTGKNEGRVGALIVEFEGNRVGVGSGLSDEQRIRYWNDRNEIVGKTIEVKYQAVTHDKDGHASLSFPVFVRVRDDKTV